MATVRGQLKFLAIAIPWVIIFIGALELARKERIEEQRPVEFPVKLIRGIEITVKGQLPDKDNVKMECEIKKRGK